MRSSSRKKAQSSLIRNYHFGAIYTPNLLADWAASLLLSMLRNKRKAVIIDPACGDGSLLSSVISLGGRRVIGVDCDAIAIENATRRVPLGKFYCTDGLKFLAEAALSHESNRPDGIIANPPWGATIVPTREKLSSLGYRVLSGQTDSWDIFVDGILRASKPGTAIVLILPDALLLPEHRPIREILARNHEIKLIARLGEGFFPGVYRGTIVLAVRCSSPSKTSSTTCVRLTPEMRRLILCGKESLSNAIKKLRHCIPQTRFINDSETRFNIDTNEQDNKIIEAIERYEFPWDTWLESGRGVELSKGGFIIRCPKCGIARPSPRGYSVVYCGSCNHSWTPKKGQVKSIIRCADQNRIPKGWHPLIVGEDVDRHSCKPSRMLRMNVKGIRYKSLSIFSSRKLLVRKTGVGIKAAVDESGAATNQVVFHFTLRSDAPSFILDYLQGVLCSRIVLAWHLKRHGESEWRSHPYITQHIIRHIPIPQILTDADRMQAQAIAEAVCVRRLLKNHDSKEDILIERLVGGMYGLSSTDMKWVVDVINSAQKLEPFRTLQLPNNQPIDPIHVV